ncbi:hypothetical protein JNM05_00225 [bacterium]|nr:hypothetical protein [bacterium]
MSDKIGCMIGGFKMKLKQFKHWAQKEYSAKQRLTLVIPALVFRKNK